jgi:hypothetical protein
MSNILSGITKYLLLVVISFLVISNLPVNKLDKNETLLLSITIALVFALVDMYSGVFSGLVGSVCSCPN